MKNTKLHNPGRIPTREEWHREFAGIITSMDYNTCSPSLYGIDNQISAWRFNESGKKLKAEMEKAKILMNGGT